MSRAPLEEVRYDLDDSDFRSLDLTSAIGLVALAARWQERAKRRPLPHEGR